MKNIIIFLISVLMVCNICITNADSWGNTGWSSGNNKEYIRYLPFTNTLNDSLGVIWFNTSDSNFYYVDKAGVHIIGSGSGIKADSAIYADSSFNLFADSNYVVNKITGDTVVVGDNSLIDNGTYIQTSNFQGGVIFASSYLKTQKIYNDATYPIFINASANAYNDSLMIIAKCVDTVWTADSFNNTHFYNNVIVDDTLTIGDNTMYDIGAYIYTNGIQAVNATLTNIFTLKIKNMSNYPLVFNCGNGTYDSITCLLYGVGDTVVIIDSLNNVRIRNNMTVDDTLIYYNSNQILFSVIIQDSILTITQDAWTSFKFAKQKLNTDTDYFLFAPANDSTKVIIKKAGYYKFKAKYAYDNNSGASVTDLLVAGRLTVNSKELLCSQILRQCEMKNATSRVLATSGFFNASVNDTIRFEYYSSDPNIDFHTSSIFDSLFTVGMSLEYMK